MKRFLLAAGALLALAVLLRVPALDQPLDRDSALYAAIGQRLGLDALPYRDLFDHKQPLIHYVYGALDLVAPGSLLAIRLAAALPSAILAALLLVFLEPLTGLRRAAVAAAAVVVLSASTAVQGTDLNTEHLLTLPAAATVLWALALDRPGVRGGPFAIGLLGGVAILAKSIALLIVLAALIPLLAARPTLAVAVRFGAGLALPGALVLLVYTLAGAADDLWFANWTYNARYVGEQGFSLTPRGPAGVQLLMAGALCCGVLRLGALRGRDVVTWTFLAWLVGAWLGAQTSSRGFPHYYAPMIAPAVALLVLPTGALSRVLVLARGTALGLAALGAILLAVPVATNFGRSGDAIARDVYGANEVARWTPADTIGPALRRRARSGDRLFVVGAEPQYYWRSGIRPANRWLFDYPREIVPERFNPELADLCADGPRFVVLAGGPLPSYARRCTAANGYTEVMRRGPAVVLERSAVG